MSSTCHTFGTLSRFPAAGWPRPIKEEHNRWRPPLRQTKTTPLGYPTWRASLVSSVPPALCGTAATGAGVGNVSEPSALRGVWDSWPLAVFSRGRLGAGDKHKAPPPCGRRLCASYVTQARGGGASSLVYCTVEHCVPGRLVVAAVVCYGIIGSQTDTARRTWPADWHISQPSDESEQK